MPSPHMNISLQGSHITFKREDAVLENGTFGLLADLAAAISIAPGEFRRVPVAMSLQGDGATIALIEVHAGQHPGHAGSAVQGQFLVPSRDIQEDVSVIVHNETPATLMIQPGWRIGLLSFRELATADGSQREDAPQHADAAGHPIADADAVYAPQHIDPAAFPAPGYQTELASGMDLRADIPEAITLGAGERRMIDTGFRVAIPAGLEGQVRPRSGLAFKHGITVTNSPATIDADYRGEVKVVLQNTSDEPFPIAPGDRIAQFVFAPVVQVSLAFVDQLGDTVRGQGGFGSTGR